MRRSDQRRDAAFALYQRDVTGRPLDDLLAGAKPFTRDLAEGADASLAEIDAEIGASAHGWTLGRKTGSSGSWKGVTAATNDVGILTAPDDSRLSIVVFIADSRAPEKERAALMANVAQVVIAQYRK